MTCLGCNNDEGPVCSCFGLRRRQRPRKPSLDLTPAGLSVPGQPVETIRASLQAAARIQGALHKTQTAYEVRGECSTSRTQKWSTAASIEQTRAGSESSQAQSTDASQRTRTTSGHVQATKLPTPAPTPQQFARPPKKPSGVTETDISPPTRTSPAPSVLLADIRPSLEPEAAAGPSTKPSRASEPTAGPSKVSSRTSGATASSSKSLSQSQPRRVNIGIETEFYITEARGWHPLATDDSLVNYLARRYNKNVPLEHPRMRKDLMYDKCFHDRYDEWAIIKDYSVATGFSPWGLEMVSPILHAFPGSNWRNHVKATWNFLHQNYKITGNDDCATHVHVSLDPPYKVTEIKKIAQAVIHFEPAIEVVVPDSRRANRYCKSNWLNAPGFLRAKRTRPETIASLERETYLLDVLAAMQPYTGNWCMDRNFCWNFSNISSKSTIEFRKPPASLDADTTLSWAEFAMSFVQAAIKCESPDALQKVPANIRGLRWFLEQGTIPGMNEPGRLDRLWEGKDPDLVLEPAWFYLDRLDLSQHRDSIEKLTLEDNKRLRMIAKRAKAPYWKRR